jgi:hypothetical protein
MKSKSFLFLLSCLFLFFGCGKAKNHTTTDISFNFKSSINSTSPERFVLFAHNETRLEKARVLVPGSNNLTLPNGIWKFSVIGFENTSATSPYWPVPQSEKSIICGFTDYYNFNGTAETISITVSNASCTLESFILSSNIIISGLPTTYSFKWILPSGDRDNINNDNGIQQSFLTNCLDDIDGNYIHFPKNLSDEKILPYFLILRLYSDITCSVEIGEIHFDGDIYSPPIMKWNNVDRTESIFSIFFGAEAPIEITIPKYP